jgi:MFS family permease
MITDLFPKRRLAFALSVYGMGIYLGSGLARFFGGYAIEFARAFDNLYIPVVGREIYSWQIVFFLIAAPTVPLSILLLAIREPVRRGVRQTKTAQGDTVEVSVPYSEVLAYLWQNRRTMLTYSCGFALLAFSGYGAAAWIPSHLMRNFGWTPKEVGVAVGTAAVTAGPMGILFGGWLSDMFRRRGIVHARLLVALISAAGWIPFGIAYPLVDSGTLAVWMYAPAIGIGAMTAGVGPAGIQEIMPNKMRGQASAIYLFIINLMGLGLGPFIIPLFTQYVFGSDADVRLSLLTVPVAAHALASIFLLSAIRPYVRSLARVEEWQSREDEMGV